MNVPSLTLRDSTERPETIDIGTNVLVGTDPAGLAPVLDRLFSGRWQVGGVPEKWDGQAGTRIAAILEQHGCWEPLWRVEGIDSGHDRAGEAPFCQALRMVRD